MRDEDHRDRALHVIDRLLHLRLGFAIERTRRLVEYQQARLVSVATLWARGYQNLRSSCQRQPIR